MVHVNATAASNETVTDMIASHVGQLYFDQDLINKIEKEPAYLANTQPLTLNSGDFLLSSENGSDPFVNYDFLGDKVADGLLGWITIAVNRTTENARKVYNAATLTKEGGVANPEPGTGSSFGFGGGAPPAGFSFPSGATFPGRPTSTGAA